MRINKLFSNYGYCSRKEANKWIREGRVIVNQTVAIEGQWVELTDDVRLDGQALTEQPRLYIVLNKPVGVVCTAEKDEPNNVLDYLGLSQYVFPVGRLDKDSEGLLLLTNDGDLANALLYSENEKEKVYHVTVNRPFDDAFLRNMSQGVALKDVVTKPCEIERLTEDTFEIKLCQGLNRQIRRMCQTFYYKVVKLQRVRLLNLKLGSLPLGDWRFLTDEEIFQLRAAINFTFIK